MSFSTNLVAVARRLIQDYGQQVTFNDPLKGLYNPLDGTTDTVINVNFTIYAFISSFDKNDVDGTVIKSSDLKLYVGEPANTTRYPKVGNTVTIDSIVYRVVNVKTITAQSTDIMYEVQCSL